MGGLHVVRSNRLEALVAVLAEQLRLDAADPLRAHEVVVGSRGMERHLRQALAEHLGICAQIDFPFPRAALDALASGGPPGIDPWSPGPLAWALLEALPGLDPEVAAPLTRLLGSATDGPVDGRAAGLARRVAEVFDSYATWRPEWLAAWRAGGSGELPDGQRWQAALWRAVDLHLDQPPLRSERLAAAADAVEDGTLHWFGLSGLAPAWLATLATMARHRRVALYLLCPSDQYWADLRRRIRAAPGLSRTPRREIDERLRDDDEGHPLLSSWGRTGRDLQVLLEELPDGFADRRTDLFVAPDARAALGVLQADVLAARHPIRADGFADRRIDPADASIQVHVCHGPTRQVEVLRTALLALLDADPTLQPRDIVVMTPDIDAFAPRIRAVFDAGSTGRDPPRLPWDLADLSVRRLNPVADALLRVLELVDGRASAPDVLDLLALEPVAERFGISADDLLVARGMVVDSGARWAVDAAHRAAHGQPADPQNTWRFGLERLLLGVVMMDDGRLPGGARPLERVEGGASALVGRLAAFCGALFSAIDQLRDPRPLGAWARALAETVDALTRTSGKSAWLTRRVRDELTALAEEARVARSTRPLDVGALRGALARRFDVASSAHHGSGGAITFCGMVPERAVPYRVVCLLGMDEGSFPRSSARASFDRIADAPRPGDRDLRDEDRYLLLEAVLSARTHLLVLYTGRDVRTNEARPPAAPVSELLDALDATWPEPARDRFTRRHPLQAFDARDFAAPDPWSYDGRLVDAVRASLGARGRLAPLVGFGPSIEAPADADPLDLETLIRFWQHPVRAWLQRGLGIRLPRDGDGDVPSREPIELGWVEHAALLDAALAADDPAALADRLRASGELPLGGAGRVVLASARALGASLRGRSAALLGGPAASMDVDLDVDGLRIVGRVDGLGAGARVSLAYGAEREGPLLDAWIRLLAWRAMAAGSPGRAAVLFGRIDGAGRPILAPVGLEPPATAGLAALVDGWRAGRARPLPFFPRASLAFARAVREAAEARATRSATLAAGLAAAREAWAVEGADRYHQHAFGGAPPFVDADGAPLPEFMKLAVALWGPILQARRPAATVDGWGAP